MANDNERFAALRALLRIQRDGAYSNLALEEILRGGTLSPRGRAFCSALVYGVTERRLTLDAVLARYVRRPLSKLDPEVLCILRMGLYQLFYMDGVPDSAAVNESVRLCGLCKKSSAGGFVNGVLRALKRDGAAPPGAQGLNGSESDEELSLVFSAPVWLIRHFEQAYGRAAALDILRASLLPAPLCVRANTLRCGLPGLLRELEGEGVRAHAVPGVQDAAVLETPGALEQLGAWKAGRMHVQDISSQRCAAALCAGPGMRVLDACAAPGGKSFTAAQYMCNQGEVVSCDLYPHKIELIRQGAQRLGIDIIIPRVQNAEEYNESLNLFDRVLCDVPCSGLGILRRKPEIKYKSQKDLGGLPQIQYKILENSAQYTKPGGLLVYSTCTLNPAENEEVTSRFLSGHTEFEPFEQPLLDGYRRTFLPAPDVESDGFFIASMKKKA